MSIDTRTPAPGETGPRFGPLFRLSVGQYLDMIRAGIFGSDDRVELLEGVLVAKMGKNPPHVLSTKRIFRALSGVLPPGWHVAKEDPVRLRESVPEPDCAVLRGADVDYRDRLPEPPDIALIVEVADTSLANDRESKRRSYARAAIPTYWIVNLIARRIEVESEPTGPADDPSYRSSRHYGADDELPVVLDCREVARLAVRDLMP